MKIWVIEGRKIGKRGPWLYRDYGPLKSEAKTTLERWINNNARFGYEYRVRAYVPERKKK